jgi:hypothetical protein
MEKFRTLISLREIRSFYLENCSETGQIFTEKKFREFIDCCERDFFQWLIENLKYFESGN